MYNRILDVSDCQEKSPDLDGPGLSDDGARAVLRSAASLPCLYSNNSIEESKKSLKSCTGYASKRAFAVRDNAARFIAQVGIERVGFLTLTFADSVIENKEASRRFNSLNSNLFPLIFGAWQRVSERTKKGCLHYHLIVDCLCDIRTGFDFDLYLTVLALKKNKLPYRSLERRVFRTANPNLRNFWQILRGKLGAYGFGRHELLPIRTNIELAAKYVSKYLTKSDNCDLDKGSRRVEYSRGQIRSNSKFSWLSPGAVEWRRKLSLFAEFIGAESMYDIKKRFGRHWAFFLSDVIMGIDDIILGTYRGEYRLSGGELVDMRTGQILF